MATSTSAGTDTLTAASASERDRKPAKKPTAPWLKTARTYLGVAIIVIWGLGPFYWMGVTAFRDLQFTFDTTPWPTHVTWDNFETVFSTARGTHFGCALVNSVIISGLTTIISMVVGVFTAYALARLEFRGKFVILGFVLAASMFPGVALITPLFELFTNIGWFGTYQALVIPDISFALPLTIYVLTAFFRDMPWELEEAAKIDGASPGQAFRLVILPLAAPGIFTAAILAFITAWNEFTIASQLSSDATQPVTVAIASFAGAQPHVEPYTAVMAAGFVVTVPLIIMVLAFQRRIVAGLTAGGVKG
jgi:multiple sugar transport system permease protein